MKTKNRSVREMTVEQRRVWSAVIYMHVSNRATLKQGNGLKIDLEGECKG